MWYQPEMTDSMDNHVTDSTKKRVDQQDSGIVDSGFLSSGNLLLSSNEFSGELDSPFNSGVIDEEVVDGSSAKCDFVAVQRMQTDSGLDLGISESLSQMNLSPVNMETAGEVNKKSVNEKVHSEPMLEPVIIKADDNNIDDDDDKTHMVSESEPREIEPWQLYYLQDQEGDTQLHIAIIQGFLEAAAFSLIRMAPHPCLLDIVNDDGEAPLHLAVLTKQHRIARRLVVGGANPGLRDRRGNTALHIACATGDLCAARALTDPLATIERNYLGPHKRIPALPQDLEQRNYRGEMCLHVAASRDQVELVRLLLRLGADLEAREGLSGKTALHLAIELNCRAVVTFFLNECRPCLDAVTYSGLTTYQIAVCRDRKLAEELVRHGATAEPLPESDTDMSDDSTDEDTPYTPEIVRLPQRVGVRASS